VKICADQPIEASADEAQAALLDPGFYASLVGLEGISAPELCSIEASDGHVRAVVGYRFSGELSGPAAAILDPAKLSWAQITDTDLATRRTEVTMAPDNYANLLSFSGWYEIRPVGDGSCVQHLEATLTVHLPLLGRLAERALAGSVRKNLGDTAALLGRYVASKRPYQGGGRPA
jgi:hypothetical protein